MYSYIHVCIHEIAGETHGSLGVEAVGCNQRNPTPKSALQHRDVGPPPWAKVEVRWSTGGFVGCVLLCIIKPILGNRYSPGVSLVDKPQTT